MSEKAKAKKKVQWLVIGHTSVDAEATACRMDVPSGVELVVAGAAALPDGLKVQRIVDLGRVLERTSTENRARIMGCLASGGEIQRDAVG